MEPENKPSILSDLLVTHTMGNHLYDTAKWCRFLGIIGAVCLGFFLVVVIAAADSLAPALANYFPGSDIMVGNVLLVVVGVFLFIFGVLLFFLLRFAILTKRGLETRNQTTFNDGLKSLRIYYIMFGIIGILSVVSNIVSLFSTQ